MSEYLLLNIFIIIVPLILTFEKKIQFYKKLPALLISILFVGGGYIIWDAIATLRGDWAFNPKYLIGVNFLNLPLEEILFFITVPYSTIFLYETGKLYLKESEIKISKKFFMVLSIALIITALIYSSQYYTITVLLFCSLFILINLFPVVSNLLKSKIYWLWIAFTYIPFLVVNYILTSLPIVTYSPDAIWGLRVTTIPVEDFFYSFSMLSFYLFVYLLSEEKWLIKK
mgnify:CR=1 FL=1